MKNSEELIEELIDATLAYWDGYYSHGSAINAVKEDMKKILDKWEKD